MCNNPVVTTYEAYEEEKRLTTDNARRTEFLTTVHCLDMLLPKKSKVLDCAAGTGIYAFYLAEQGHAVCALDITPRHVDIMNDILSYKAYAMETGVNDARNLSRFVDESFDAVLCMGPLYHLTEEADRRQCLQECLRVLKQGGLLFSAYINRFCVVPHIITKDFKYLDTDLIQTIRETGVLRDTDPLCFWTDTYYYTPEEIEDLYGELHIQVVDHVAADGFSLLLREEINAMDAAQYRIWFDYYLSTCRERSILGASNHALLIGKKG